MLLNCSLIAMYAVVHWGTVLTNNTVYYDLTPMHPIVSSTKADTSSHLFSINCKATAKKDK